MTRNMKILNYFNIHCFHFIFSVFLTDFTSAMPNEYCFYKLNITDCGHRPTPVFTYYLPGSRCEIETWRGCPTYNKFDDEVQCAHSCIGRMFADVGYEQNELLFEIDDDPCTQLLNSDNCTKEQNVTVYTFNAASQSCVEATWNGCDTKNKFNDKKACLKECVKDEPFREKMSHLQTEEANEVMVILDEVIKIEDEPIEIPTTSTKALIHAAEETTTAAEEHTTATEEHTTATEEHTTAAEETTTAIEETTAVVEETSTATEKPLTTTTEVIGEAEEIITTL